MKKNYSQPELKLALLTIVDVLNGSPNDPYGDDVYTMLEGEDLL